MAEDEVVGEIETDKVSVKLKLKLKFNNIAISCFVLCNISVCFLGGDHYPCKSTIHGFFNVLFFC